MDTIYTLNLFGCICFNFLKYYNKRLNKGTLKRRLRFFSPSVALKIFLRSSWSRPSLHSPIASFFIVLVESSYSNPSSCSLALCPPSLVVLVVVVCRVARRACPSKVFFFGYGERQMNPPHTEPIQAPEPLR
ncbi:uncharacterized protein LOC127741216 [Arachis duranensis]|uniref:Uncharacterized protein LOC127741216 n=1 Tax=Arachis duranensis TaxID=130453 RepID=A0A9C6T3J0_ARADU|nr:uncharacterized protein LOC127741216 [Arachis duranensis]